MLFSRKSALAATTTGGLVRQSYGAFGQPRNGATWAGAVPSGDAATIDGFTRRGYTGHSMLGAMGLIHMNGRVLDAQTGRFLSPDPYVQDPGFTQSFNRYSYVANNPLSYYDPSGFMSAGTNCTRRSVRDHEAEQQRWNNILASFNRQNNSAAGAPNAPMARPNGDQELPEIFVNAQIILWPIYKTIEVCPGDMSVAGGGSGGGGGGSAGAPQGDFHYKVHDFAFCSADSLFSQFSKPDSSAPGAPAAVPGTTPDVVLTGGNPITQIVDADARTITNVTQDGHRYHSGTVEIKITPTWYGSRVSIEGRGTGPHYWENRLLGSALFSALAAKATISCTFGAE